MAVYSFCTLYFWVCHLIRLKQSMPLTPSPPSPSNPPHSSLLFQDSYSIECHFTPFLFHFLSFVVYRISERFSVSWGPNPSDKSSNVFDVVLLPVVPVNQTMDTFIRIGVVSGSMTYLMTMSEKAAERSSTEGLLGEQFSSINFDDREYCFVLSFKSKINQKPTLNFINCHS